MCFAPQCRVNIQFLAWLWLPSREGCSRTIAFASCDVVPSAYSITEVIGRCARVTWSDPVPECLATSQHNYLVVRLNAVRQESSLQFSTTVQARIFCSSFLKLSALSACYECQPLYVYCVSLSSATELMIKFAMFRSDAFNVIYRPVVKYYYHTYAVRPIRFITIIC